MPCLRPPDHPTLQMRIQLRGVSPPIWRRVLIPETATILDLHNVIQVTMGWEDSHLSQFTLRGQLYCIPREGVIRFSPHPDRIRLVDFDFHVHDRFFYEYDFYSRWVHDIRVEKRIHEVTRPQPVCVSGVGSCPPEDSGPIGHFMQVLDEHSVIDTFEWLQESIDDQIPMKYLREELIDRLRWLERRFNKQETNARLQPLI